MAEYDDLKQIEALYAEQAILDQALTILEDHDGKVVNFTVAPTFPSGAPPVAIMSVLVSIAEPKQNLNAAAHAACVQRYNQINKELRDLGVTGGPPDHAQGGGGGPPSSQFPEGPPQVDPA